MTCTLVHDMDFFVTKNEVLPKAADMMNLPLCRPCVNTVLTDCGQFFDSFGINCVK